MKRSLWILFLFVFAPSISESAELVRFEFEEPHMGTKFRIVLYAPDQKIADQAAKEAFARVAFLDRTMSDYQVSSELMRLCAKNADRAGEPVKVSPELYFVLSKGLEVSELSNGAFDVTVGPVIQLWRHARRTQRLPDAIELADARKKTGYKHLQLDPATQSVRLMVPGMRLDLGGIAKGYAADEILAVLQKHGITRALAAAGGDIAVADAPPDKESWVIDIEPLPGTKEKRSLKLKNAAVSTSGDSQNFVVIDGVRYSHIVDPRTGIGLTGSRLVTVIAKKGIQSDPLTKLAAVLPPDQVLPILEKIDGVSACLTWKTEKGEQLKISKGFEGWLAK